MVARLCKCDLADFALDKAANFAVETSVGMRNTLTVRLLLATYDAMLKHVFLSARHGVEACAQVAALHRKCTVRGVIFSHVFASFSRLPRGA